MSDSEESATEEAGRRSLGRLETVVGRLLDEHADALERAKRAEARVEDLESLLRSFGKGTTDDDDLHAALLRMKERNRKLRGRIDQGREGVERLLAQLRFLDEQG